MQVKDCYTQDPRSVTSVRDYADPSSDRPARRWLCDFIGKIQHYGHSLGKRDKLQLFLCLAARYAISVMNSVFIFYLKRTISHVLNSGTECCTELFSR